MKQQLAYVHPEAYVAENVVIEPFVSVGKNVEIGEGTWIGPNASIMEGARIGRNCKIFPGAVISAIPQDLKFKGEETTAEIGDNTTIRECVTVNRGTQSKGKTVVGDNCLLMAYVHVAHDCFIGNHVILGNTSNLAGEIKVDDYAILSGLVAVHQFVHIGAHVMISGGALVRKDVPPFIKAAREPLSFVGINSIGLRRRNFSSEKIQEIQDIYREVYQKGNNKSQAIEKIEASIPNTKERNEIIQFIRNSKRGVIKGYLSEE
ncbi:MAG: acyl-ACP--UDP-N-acetylglucosamine O-acyltransferase [Bacteroidales bacterium]|nr:acyl-ACP--UDP-N-acetylglucosamine O-acyltransferase [Bacteroidales bacterium]